MSPKLRLLCLVISAVAFLLGVGLLLVSEALAWKRLNAVRAIGVVLTGVSFGAVTALLRA